MNFSRFSICSDKFGKRKTALPSQVVPEEQQGDSEPDLCIGYSEIIPHKGEFCQHFFKRFSKKILYPSVAKQPDRGNQTNHTKGVVCHYDSIFLPRCQTFYEIREDFYVIFFR